MAIDDFLLLTGQCCDAIDYLRIGERCALGEGCYDALRPMGAVYWFALPFWLGVPLEWLLVLQALLLLVSAWLGAAALRQALWRLGRCHAGRWQWWLLPVSLVLHGVAFRPLLDLALSDAPANLFALMGCWLLLGGRGGTRPVLAGRVSGWHAGCAPSFCIPCMVPCWLVWSW